MKYYRMVWILWSNDMFSSKVKHDDKQGVHIVELFAHKIDAEAFMRKCREEDDPVGGRYWIQEKEVVQ